MKVNDSYFEAVHTAYKSLPIARSFHYDFSANFIYCPTEVLGPETAFDLMHEISHSQVGNGVMGMALQALMECAAIIEERLFVEIMPYLEPLKSTPKAPSLYQELYLLGTSADLSDPRLPGIAANVFAHCSSLCESLERIVNRFRAIISRWECLHEGIAVLSTIHAAKSLTQADDYIFRFLLDVTGSSPNAILTSIGTTASQVHARYESGFMVGPKYEEGYALCNRAFALGGITGVWLLALIASHFDYPNCDLIDMDDKAFNSWAESGFNFNARFQRLLDAPELVSEALGMVADGRELEIEIRRRLLCVACGQDTTGPSGICNFWRWERTRIFQCDLMRPIISDGAFNGAFLFENPEKWEDGKATDFRIPEKWIPSVILRNGRVIGTTKQIELVRRRFARSYMVQRTVSLLESLRSTLN